MARLTRIGFRGRRRWSLRLRLVAVVLLALLPIAGLLAFLWHSARERDRDDALGNLTQTSEAVAVIADTVFDEGITLGQAIATDPTVQSLDPARFVPRLREINALAPHYTNIIVADASGTVLGWSAPEPPPPTSVADRPFFAQVTGSRQPTTIPVVDGQGSWTLGTGVAVPLASTDGSVVGLVAITFDPEHVARRLGQVRPFSGQGFALIDPTGRIAMVLGPAAQLASGLTWEQRDRSHRPEVQAALAGQVTTSTTFRGALTGQERLAAFAPTPRHGWVVVSTWTIEQALGPTRQAAQRELVIFVAIVLTVLAGALAASRALIEPLRRLAEHARRLGDGRFERIDDPMPDDEIGDLAASFNVMGERLQGILDDLRRERAHLETIVEHLPVGVLIVAAPDGRMVMTNAELERIAGRTTASLATYEQYSTLSVFHLDGRPMQPPEWAPLRALFHGEAIRGEEVLFRRDDGDERILSVDSAPIRAKDGQIVAAVSVVDDITERRQTEARLHEREQLIGALVDQFPGAVAVLDRELRFVLVAGRPVVNHHHRPEELIGRRLPDLYPAEVIAATAEYQRRAWDGETASFDCSVGDKALRMTITPLRNGDGLVEHLLTVGFDVTEERARLDRATRDEKLRALGQMAGGIAHNLNQTLALVMGYGELLRTALDQDPPDLDELRRMLGIVEHAAYDGGETVKRLLTVARGQSDTQRQTIDVAELLHEVAQLTEPRWRSCSIVEGGPVELHVQAEPGLLTVGSRAGLREVLTNLIFNAIEAMPEGGTIALSARRSDDQVVVEVADTGSGMTPEVRSRIFEPFFSTKGERGTGLGLAMVFSIVRWHGGQIDVTTEPGRGTTFRLNLLASEATGAAAPATGEERPARSLRILVVDDETRLAALAAGMLRRDGHQATETGSGREALDRLRTEPFDLVISDLSMGDGMNGWELAAATEQLVPGLPVVLATGWGAAIDEEEARGRGVRAVLAKPFRISDLRDVVARVVPV